MKNILLHGLGQNNSSWDTTSLYLKEKGMLVDCPNLFDLTIDNATSYQNIYVSFSKICNDHKGKLNLCGLSLGGILALDYAKNYPEKVNSIVIIGAPFKLPKVLLSVQNVIFHLMPKSKFEAMGYSKKDFITLANSMNNFDISKDLDNINCKSLFMCGIKDTVNMKSAKMFNETIKGSSFKTIPDASHEVNVDNAEGLANILYDFWKEEV